MTFVKVGPDRIEDEDIKFLSNMNPRFRDKLPTQALTFSTEVPQRSQCPLEYEYG